MIRSNSRPRLALAPGRPRAAFTIVELLVVIVILAILIALLLPAINAAFRTAKSSAAQAEINQLAQALADFKSKYGEYPPSRVLLSEDGLFPVGDNSRVGPDDITVGQLAQRSLAAMRRFFPKVNLSSSNLVWAHSANANRWYDFNGNGTFEYSYYILQGHECLVFFLGGIPQPDIYKPTDPTTTKFGVSGFGKDPTNPFSNNFPNSSMYSANRQPPLFEFASSRLALDPNGLSGIPGYLDSLGNPLIAGGDQINFLAYFSAYGNGGYDPNDVNFPPSWSNQISELDVNLSSARLEYRVGFPISNVNTPDTRTAASPGPNPYTSTLTVPATTGAGTVTFLNPQTFQIISSGSDGQYGIGGQFKSNSSDTALPLDGAHVLNSTDTTIRVREKDNLTNFHNGRLD